MSSDKETKNIRVMLVIEVLGRPVEEVTNMLEKLIKQIDEEPGVNVKDKKINEPVLLKDQKDIFTSFAEVEVEVEEVRHIAVLMFKYMPAHIEILSPELIALTNNGWNDIFNELTRRLHGYDEIARVIQMEKDILEKKLKSLMPESKEEEKSEEKKE
jgi:hypothetical protein